MFEVLDATGDDFTILSSFTAAGDAIQYACEQIDGKRHIIVKDAHTGTILLDDEQDQR